MKNTIGSQLTMTLFGESHGRAIGCVLDGLPAGMPVDMKLMEQMLAGRRPSGAGSTARKEQDIPEIISGVKDGRTEGTPLTILIANNDARREDYDALKNIPRPSHADYTAHVKYLGYEDASGGGHFSGRLTAVMTAAGAICAGILRTKGILIGTHIRRIGNVEDRPFSEDLETDLTALNEMTFPVLDQNASEQMRQLISDAAAEGDSVGGILETCAMGIPAGIGEPAFDSLESTIAHAMFSIPGVKGISFGTGFGLAGMKGSEANDPWALKDGRVISLSNHSGGINGGISNGMPIVYSLVLRPTPSIAKPQKSVDLTKMEETEITVHGRHDAAIVSRAGTVSTAMCAFALLDAMIGRYGILWFTGGEE